MCFCLCFLFFSGFFFGFLFGSVAGHRAAPFSVGFLCAFRFFMKAILSFFDFGTIFFIFALTFHKVTPRGREGDNLLTDPLAGEVGRLVMTARELVEMALRQDAIAARVGWNVWVNAALEGGEKRPTLAQNYCL